MDFTDPVGFNETVYLSFDDVYGNYWDNSSVATTCSMALVTFTLNSCSNCNVLVASQNQVCQTQFSNVTLRIQNVVPGINEVIYYEKKPSGEIIEAGRVNNVNGNNPEYVLSQVKPGQYFAHIGLSCRKTNEVIITSSEVTVTSTDFCSQGRVFVQASGCHYGYKWNDGFGNVSSRNITQSGTYIVNCLNSGCNDLTDPNGPNAVVVTSLGYPQIPTVTKNADYCNNTRSKLTASNCTGTVIWNNDVNLTGQSIEVLPGTYTAVCQNSCGTSSPSAEVTVSFCEDVNIVMTAGASTLCLPATTYLQVNSGCTTDVVTFQKKNGGNWDTYGTATKSSGYVINGVGQGAYRSFCGTTAGQKFSNEVTIYSSSNPGAPTITAVGSSIVCGQNTVEIRASQCNSGEIVWSNGQTGSSITVATSGSYTAVCKTPCGASSVTSPNSNTVTVTYQAVCPCTNITITGNDVNGSINEGQTLELTVPLIAGASYTWTHPSGANVFITDNKIKVINVTPGNAGNYKVTLSCNATPAEKQINVIPIDHCGQNFSANAGSTSQNGEVSVGETYQLYANGGDSYEWTGPAGFYSIERWPMRHSAQTWHSGTYNVKITKVINGQTCMTTLPVVVLISPCRLEATPHFAESSNKFTLYTQSNVNLAQGTVKWYKNGLQISQGLWHEMDKNDNNRGQYTMVATYQTCTVEKTLYVDYMAPASYMGSLEVTSCDRIEGWIVDNNNKSKSLQYSIWVKIDNNFHEIKITTAGNGQSSSFYFDIPSRYKDGQKHVVVVHDPAGNPIWNTTNRSFRCCSLDFAQTPIVTCSTATSITINSTATGGQQYRFRLDKQERNEEGEGLYTQVADWTTISSNGSKVFTVAAKGNYKVTVRDGNDTDACKTSVVVPVACAPDPVECAPPVVTVFPSGTIREGQGITPKFYANAIPFNPSSEQGGLVMNGTTSLAIGEYLWLNTNFTLEALVNPEREAITVGDISEAGKQRYLFRSWNGGDNTQVSASLSIGSNGINVIEEGYNYKRLVLNYEGAISGWNHVALVYANNRAKLYINGSLVKSSDVPPPLNRKVVGPYLSGSYGNNGFKGSIYALRIWATPLEGTLVSQLKNNYTPALAAAPNVGFWLFDKAIAAGGFVEDLSTHKRKAYVKGGGFVLPLTSPAVSPNAPVITWWLNGVQVATGESYSMPRDRVKQGTLNYTAKYQKPDGSYCETTFPVVIEPIIFGSLSGCYLVKSSENNHPVTPYYSPGENHYRMKLSPQQANSEQQIWNFEHLGNEVYRINSAFYTDMVLENDGTYYLKLVNKKVSSNAQKFKALVKDAGQMYFSFRSESEPDRVIRHYANDTDPMFMWESYNDDGEKYKLVPTACPLPAQDCNVNGKITYERWLQPTLLTMDHDQFNNLDVKTYMKDNPASYVSVQDFGGLKMNNAILDNLNTPPKPNNWPNPDGRWVGRLSGYFCPPQNGDYYFFAKTYEWAELWISTDEDPRNKRLVSSCYGFCQTYDDQRSAPVAMSKGRSYYVELIYRQTGGGMMAEVAMVTPGSYYLDHNHQPMPLTNFSSIARDIAPGFLTISPNKPKVAPTENVTITSNGCYYGRVVWRAGTRIIENPSATIPSITEVGPGFYQAICVGDPTVVQDWVTVMIDPITDIVPIPTGPTFACANQSITLTGTAAPSGYTYKWYVIKPDQKEYFFTNRSSTNLFENAPQIFNITQNANVNVTGPGMYFLQCISPNGWKSQVREFKVDTMFSASLRASNNGPIETGNTLTLSTGVVPSATSYAWTGPNGFTAATRIATVTNFDETKAGTYTLTITAPGGCTFTNTTVVETSVCNVYINPNASNGEVTFKLKRIAGQVNQFEPLNLNIAPFVGNSTFSGYKIQWMYNGIPVAGGTSKTISINKPGEYRAVLTLKSNPLTVCEAVINISSDPCKTYELDLSCQVPNNITLANAVSAGILLSAGDEFTAGDYTVVVTEIISGSPAGWKGKGYVKMKMISGVVLNQVSVNFENAIVNECYELASGKVVTDYDSKWSNIMDVDAAVSTFGEILSGLKNLINSVDDVESIYVGNEKDVDWLKKFGVALSETKKELLINEDLTQEAKDQIIDLLNLVEEDRSSLESDPSQCEENAIPNARQMVSKLDPQVCKLESIKTNLSLALEIYSTVSAWQCKPSDRMVGMFAKVDKSNYGNWGYAIGVYAHVVIAKYYQSFHNGAELEYQIPVPTNKNGVGYADIVNVLTHEIFEIKGDDYASQARSEVETYVDNANISCSIPGFPWRKGTGFQPSTRTGAYKMVIPFMPTHRIIFWLAESGVILYDVEKNTSPVLEYDPVPSDVPIPKEYWSFYMSLLKYVISGKTVTQLEPLMLKFVTGLSSEQIREMVVVMGIGLLVGGAAITIASGGAGSVVVATQAIIVAAITKICYDTLEKRGYS